jgi:hypothetical protein
VSIVGELIAELGSVCAGLPDQRKTPPRDSDDAMADIGLSAFSLFFMGSPSFLAHQRAPARGQGRSNCQTLFGMAAIPSDNYTRRPNDRLFGAAPSHAGAGRYPRLAFVAAKKVVDTGLRRHDGVSGPCVNV